MPPYTRRVNGPRPWGWTETAWVRPMRRRRIFRKQDSGATAVEYALVIAILAAVITVAIPAMTGPLGSLFKYPVEAIRDAYKPDE